MVLSSTNRIEYLKAFFFGAAAVLGITGSRLLHRGGDTGASSFLLVIAATALPYAFGSWARAEGRSWSSGALPVLVTVAFCFAALFGLRSSVSDLRSLILGL